MSLVYALVARETVILVEHTTNRGNFTTVTQTVLDRIPDEDAKTTYVYDQHKYHLIREDGIVYMCLADGSMPSRTAFAFLAHVQEDFNPYLAQAYEANAYALTGQVGPILQRHMRAYSGEGGNKIASARADIEQVKGIMVQNIEKVLKRGEHIDLLVDKADNLRTEAVRFNVKSKKLQRQMWWKNKRNMLILVGILLLVIFIIVLAATNGFKK